MNTEKTCRPSPLQKNILIVLAGQATRLDDDPLQVAQWLQACHDTNIDIRLQINESTMQEEPQLLPSETKNAIMDIFVPVRLATVPARFRYQHKASA